MILSTKRDSAKSAVLTGVFYEYNSYEVMNETRCVWRSRMKRFSSSYVYNRSNFVLIGCDLPDDKENEWYSLACVASNIVQRGTPTLPARRLRDLLGDPPEGCGARPLRKLLTHDHCWQRTIKGAPNGSSNPALLFYEELLPHALPAGLKYLVNYILPEALITDIVEDCDNRFIDQRVDFYCPRARLVIEIDGIQHEETLQSYLDIERDMYLEQHDIKVIRIPANDLDVAKAAYAIVSRFDFDDTGQGGSGCTRSVRLRNCHEGTDCSHRMYEVRHPRPICSRVGGGVGR